MENECFSAIPFNSLLGPLFWYKLICFNFFLHFRFKKGDLVEVRWENEKGEVGWEPATIVNTPNMFNKNNYKICWPKKVGDVYEPIWVTKEKGEHSSSEVEKSGLRKPGPPCWASSHRTTSEAKKQAYLLSLVSSCCWWRVLKPRGAHSKSSWSFLCPRLFITGREL